MKLWVPVLGAAVIAAGLTGCSGGTTDKPSVGKQPAAKSANVKVGFVVKSMADSWFKTETDFAKEKAKELGVDLTVQEAKDGQAVLTTIDTMATNGVQGIIICAPEVQLGPSIKKAADSHNMKLMSVDDRLIGADKKPLADIPHLGISAANIGKQVGSAAADEMKKRGWKPEEVACLAIFNPGLETGVQRVNGAKDSLASAGFKKENTFDAPWTGSDLASASDAANAVITSHSSFKKWIVISLNDDGVLGGVRALSNRGMGAGDIIGVGINGMLAAKEWQKGQPSGMFASVLLQPKIHGATTVELMTKWIKDGAEPPKETYTSGTVINKDNYKQELPKAGVTLD